MKCINSIATVGALVWLAGCASAPTIAVLEPVGPPPADQAKVLDQGSLQVYSARQREPLDIDTWWHWDYNFGGNLFDYSLAHTDYIILTQDGKVLRYVRNAHNPADPMPALVTPLFPGHYKIEAEAEERCGETVNLVLPVVIEPGKTTVVHLRGNWKPRGHLTNSDVVRLPDGQIAGWLAAH